MDKTCNTCKETKSIDEFLLTKDKYRLNDCKECKKKYQKRYIEDNKEKLKIKALAKAKVEYVYTSERKSNSNYCNIKGCTEHKVEYLGMNNYCKSHAFDKLNNK